MISKIDVSKENIDSFLKGRDPMERIIKIECDYQSDHVYIIYVDNNGLKRKKKEPFYPFVWAKQKVGSSLCAGDRVNAVHLMRKYGIWCKKLITEDDNGNTTDRIQNGYKLMFYAIKPMNYTTFMNFFNEAGVPIYPRKKKGEQAVIEAASTKNFLAVSPVEQYMIASGKRMFKGYEDYDSLKRLTFDIETTGLNPKVDRIEQIGIRTNNGYEEVIDTKGNTKEEWDEKELHGIVQALLIMNNEDPDVICGHNTENFDWTFFMVRLQELGCDMGKISKQIFSHEIYKKKNKAVLKLGGEVEYYYPTVIWGKNITDSLHAARRAQAQDSSMKKADLKYLSKYLKINKPNRVYIPGGQISTTWNDNTKTFAFNDHNGRWIKVTDDLFTQEYDVCVGKKQLTNYTDEEIDEAKKYIESVEKELDATYDTDNEDGYKKWHEEFSSRVSNEMISKSKGNVFEDIFEKRLRYIKDENGILHDKKENIDYPEMVTGHYIAKRYLLDDLYEGDKVECLLNQANFLVAKLLPTDFTRVATMGTAAIWKLIMLAWSYENGLAVPNFGKSQPFVGGLSRLLSVGWIDKVVKLDYNSLYPSINLSWHITNTHDLSGVMLGLLNYFLTEREKYKGLKAKAGKEVKKIKAKIKNFKGTSQELDELQQELQKWEMEVSKNDKKQLPLKIISNSFFGSLGGPSIFPFGNLICAEKTTCIGRQCLRLMIHFFSQRGYKPIVGDSFTGDTPVFIKDKEGLIDIVPISLLFNVNESNIDELGREYDYSKKDFKVLCHSGWVEPSYIYRHRTDKDIYKVVDHEKDMEVEVTEDHSLYDSEMKKIKPSEITFNTSFMYEKVVTGFDSKGFSPWKDDVVNMEEIAKKCVNREIDFIPKAILNSDAEYVKRFLAAMVKVEEENGYQRKDYTKTFRAGVQFLKNKTFVSI